MNLLLGGAHLSCYQAIIVSGCVNLSTEMDVCFVVAYSNKVQQKLWISLAGDFSYLMFGERSGVTEVFFLVFRSTPTHDGIKRNFLYSPVAHVLTDPVHLSFRGEAFSAALPSLPMNDSQSRPYIAGESRVHACSSPAMADPWLIWVQILGINGFPTPPLVVQLLSHVRLFATPWTAAHQASLSFAVSQSLLKLMSFESVMPFNHLVLCCPLLLLPSVLYLPWYRWALSSISAGLGQYIFYTYPTNLSKRTWIQVFGQLPCPSPAWDTFCILWQKFWDTDRFCACLPSPACLHHWQALSGFLPHS